MQHSISERIQSIRDTLGTEYTRPDGGKLDVMIGNLWANTEALNYLKSERNLSEETIRHFKLGFETSTNAIAIPLFKDGELINIKYRLLDNPNLRYTSEANAETWVYNEGGLGAGKSKGAVLIVEGEFDCMSVWQSGIKNVISPSAGKDSYGVWLELLEKIPRVYIAYDNDEGGKSAASKLATRVGSEKCFEVIYTDSKDANEFLSKHVPEELREIIKVARPFIRQQFKTIGDVINGLQSGNDSYVESVYLPKVKMQKGWMAVVSGRSNVGKTSFVLNIADELASKGIGVLVLPFERGIESVGQRFLQVKYKTKQDDFSLWDTSEWEAAKKDCANLPLYLALPSKEETVEFISKAKRYFNTEVVIIDHLDYMVRQVSGSRGDAIMDNLQRLKRVAEENGVILLIVSHIRKIEEAGGFIKRTKRPNIEDLKGSSSLYQDPEVVAMLSETNNTGEIYVEILKNKGEMGGRTFFFDQPTGVYSIYPLGTSTIPDVKSVEEDMRASEELWQSLQ